MFLAETVTQTLDHFNRLRKAIKEAADGKEKVTELLVEQVCVSLQGHSCRLL